MSERTTGPGRRALPSGASWAALAVLVLAVYAGTLRAEFVNWDDDLHLANNTRVTTIPGLWRAWTDTSPPGFYPVTYLTFWLEWQATGGAPWLFHLDNVLLHAANAVLVGVLARALALPTAAAWLCAALWALHPVQVGTVAWVTERKNVLYVFLWLGALLLHLRGRDGHRPALSYSLSVLCFALALLSKAAAMTLPAALVLVEWARGRLDRGFWRSLAPHVAVALIAGLALLSAVPAALEAPPLAARVPLAGRIIWFYVGAFLWPHPLPVFEPHWRLQEIGPLPTLAFLAAVVVAAVVQRRLPRAALVGAGLFLTNVALVAGLVWFTFYRFGYVSDHLAYLPLLGLALVAVTGAYGLGRTLGLPERAVTAGLALWCAVLVLVTVRQVPVWRDSVTLMRHALAFNADCWVCHANLGAALADRGDVDEAMPHLERAVALEPDERVLVQLGNALVAKGRVEEAIPHYERALRFDPDDKLAHYNLGTALRQVGRAADALPHLRAAVRRDPEWAAARNNLGVALRELGDNAAAAAEFEAVLRQLPHDLEANLNRAAIAAEAQDWATAMPHYERVVRAHPEAPIAHAALADALVAQGKLRDAVVRYEEARRLAPDDADTASALAWLHATAADAGVRDGAAAVRLAERASELSGGENPDHLDTLAAAYAEAGRFADAVRTAERALATAEPGSELAGAITQRLDGYRAGQPYREP